LARNPLTQAFIKILRLLSFHIFFRLAAGGLKPPSATEASEI